MMKVLLVDDDMELTALLQEYLSEEGYDVSTAVDGRSAVNAAMNNAADLIVLDVMMPRMNGIEVLRRIRECSQVPILMLTARGDDVDRITGLNLGADDYVPKPCSPGELAARVRAILRRTSQSSQAEAKAPIIAGRLVLHPANRSAEWDGHALDLTGTEFSLLEVLARHAGELVSKQEISKRAFGQPLAPFDRRIDVHISSVRQKLGRRNDGQSQILSVRGQGYQLLVD
ncbi:DNA-binding response regulator [Thioclava sp. L04-15]|uniref:response regulator transcription factor n=1 Tax=Thioclava sp. L04-15 TaxID=1915318 RepID=UPI0009971C6A|nr:response regulator transcription factor [Thioclava sp. L04-15]OOY28439.1 DNA-binding response regulator [Thioclava sp. L04-15]